jgi:predicted AAA+ superfamily ATPase
MSIKWRLFKRRSKVETPALLTAKPTVQASPLGDLSLRANPDSYFDRTTESSDLLTKIERSSSSVIGIAGPRGAGKSSLALKVLQQCESESRGYFTLLIQSPTGYEPRDFLLSVFQRICEEAIRKIQVLFREVADLEQRADAARAAIGRRRKLLIAGFVAASTISTAFMMYEYQSAG